MTTEGSSYWTRTLTGRLSRRRALATSGVAALSAGLLAACGSDNGGTESKSSLVTEPEETTKQAKRGGILKDRSFADPQTLDILTPNNPATPFCHEVYSGLVQFKPGYLKPSENEVAPDLAESWEYSPDGLQITLKLRQGIRFHNKPPINGRAMDMDDVLASWNRYASKASGRVNLVNSLNPDAPILSLTASDSRTLVMKLKEPLVYALGLFVPSGASGVMLVPKETDSTLDLRSDMLGTGPWYLANYTPSVGFTFKRNAEYYDKDWALVDQIDRPLISEYAAAHAQLKTGNIYIFGQGGAPVLKQEDVLPLKKDEPRLLIYKSALGVGGAATTGRRLAFGWLPAGKSPFLDERVRQAISMSWDRDLHIDVFHNVTQFEAEGLPVETRWNTALSAINEGYWLDPKGKDFGPNAKYFKYDLPEAKKLLAAAGYPNGFETYSNYVTTTELGNTPAHAEVVDGFIRDLGIRVAVRPIDYLKEYVPGFRDGRGQFEGWAYVSSAGGATGGSAIGTLAVDYWSKSGAAFKGFSVSGQNDQSGDPQVDAMIEKARVERDTEKHRALVFDLQRYLAKPWYTALIGGPATGFLLAWPCVGNFRVWQDARTSYRFWIDDTKPPFRSG